MSIEIPKLRALVRHALPNVVEATLAPLAVFYGAMWAIGVWGALGAALVWSYGAIGFRLVTGRRVPGILLLGAFGLTARTVVALASGSTFVYFLQPSLGTVAVAGTFLMSVPAGRPLAQHLAVDFCPLPEAFMAHPHVQVFFARISVLWGFVFLANAATTVWLLMSQSIGVYLLAKTVTGWALSGSAIGISAWWFLRSMRGEGIAVTRAPA
ncbi:MAG: hypothetical protein HYU28_07960 [Actinobacteria bacterium]|nr:hypothetical protein [Actinomycetota bacterium]